MTYRFQHRIYRRPLRIPLRTAHGLWTEREGIVVRLEGEDHRVGYGEIAPVPGFGTETLAEAAERCAGWRDRVDDEQIAALPAQWGAMRFALATALQPPAVLPPGRVPLTALLPAGEAARPQLADRLESGWLTFKWKVGVAPIDRELGLLDELCGALPSFAKLRLDANGAWTRRQAEQWLQRCTERPVEFVEQPVAPADESALRGLADSFPVTLALDESVVRLADARRWQDQGWQGVFVLKPAICGPLEEIVTWAEATRADVVISSAIESALARAAIVSCVLRHAATLARRSPGLGVGELFGDRRWDGPVVGPVIDDGWVRGVDAGALWNALS